MRELRLIVRVKNNLLVTFREKMNLTQSAMAEKCGIHPSTYGRIENLELFPVAIDGSWSRDAVKISSFVGEHEEFLFPDSLKLVKQRRIERELSVSALPKAVEIMALPPSENFEKKEMSRDVNEVLGTLSKRDYKIVSQHFLEGKDFYEIANDIGICHQVVRIHYANAMRRLRHPTRSNILKEHWHDG